MLRPEDITVDVLDRVAEEWDTRRLIALVRAEVIVKAKEWHEAAWVAEKLHMQCLIRARRLRMLGFDKKEIGELFDVTRTVVNKWTKGMDDG